VWLGKVKTSREEGSSMSDADQNAMQILKSWVLNLRIGNDS
jgi:hypothetical protein